MDGEPTPKLEANGQERVKTEVSAEESHAPTAKGRTKRTSNVQVAGQPLQGLETNSEDLSGVYPH